jgi:NADPH:quinone reductase-like Zn-dependent oxidoreductase
MSPDAERTIRSLGVERPGEPFYAVYREGPPCPGEIRLDLLYTGLSAGTELTFLKGTNPYLHARWDAASGVFLPGEPSVRYPVPFMGYMEVAEIVASAAPGFAPGDVVAATFGHKTGHIANPAHDLVIPLPSDLDPILGIFVAQMGPIAANGILHADAEALGIPGARLGAGIAGRPVVVWGGGVVGLLTALFARRAGAEVLVAEPSEWRRHIADRLGLEAFPEDEAWIRAKRRSRGSDGPGADIVFQTRPRADSLHLALNALRPQGAVIDLAFYQEGLGAARLGEAFHHNGLAIRCAQISRVPRGFAPLWDRRRLADETIALLRAEGDAIRQHLVTHVVPFDESADFLRRLPLDRPDFLQVVFGR